VYALAAVVGGAALAGLLTPVATPLAWLAALLLIGLAARTARTAFRHYREPVVARPRTGLSTPGRAFAGLLGLTLLNPATVVYFAALVLGRRVAAALTAADELVFVVAAFAASASWQLLLAGGGSMVGRVMTGPTGQLVTALVSSLVIVVLAAALLLAAL
jgi:arginine exporter protein ArgO